MTSPSPDRARIVAENVSTVLNCAYFVTHHGKTELFPAADWAPFRKAATALFSALEGAQVNDATGIDFGRIKTLLPQLIEALDGDDLSARDEPLRGTCAEFLEAFPIEELAPAGD